jgi:alkylated DNA repair dioxygenase AlkB
LIRENPIMFEDDIPSTLLTSENPQPSRSPQPPRLTKLAKLAPKQILSKSPSTQISQVSQAAQERYMLGDNSWYEKKRLPFLPEKNIMQALWDLHPANKTVLRMFGKQTTISRYSENYGAKYMYSGVIRDGNPLPDGEVGVFLKQVMDWVNSDSNANMNQMLINWYPDGESYIGWHSDDIRYVVKDSPIYSISLGASRNFQIQSKTKESSLIDIPVEHGDVLVMGGKMQQYYKHQVPKKSGSRDWRISLTFRSLKEDLKA